MHTKDQNQPPCQFLNCEYKHADVQLTTGRLHAWEIKLFLQSGSRFVNIRHFRGTDSLPDGETMDATIFSPDDPKESESAHYSKQMNYLLLFLDYEYPSQTSRPSEDEG